MASSTLNECACDARQPAWASRKVQLAIVILLAAVGVALRVENLDGIAFRSPDERNYTAEAGMLLEQGMAAFPLLVDAHSKNPDLPSPTRAGYRFYCFKRCN